MARANRQFRSSLDLDLQGNVLLGADHNWSDEVAYQAGDLVVYDNLAWIGVSPVDGTAPDAMNTSEWTQISAVLDVYDPTSDTDTGYVPWENFRPEIGRYLTDADDPTWIRTTNAVTDSATPPGINIEAQINNTGTHHVIPGLNSEVLYTRSQLVDDVTIEVDTTNEHKIQVADGSIDRSKLSNTVTAITSLEELTDTDFHESSTWQANSNWVNDPSTINYYQQFGNELLFIWSDANDRPDNISRGLLVGWDSAADVDTPSITARVRQVNTNSIIMTVLSGVSNLDNDPAADVWNNFYELDAPTVSTDDVLTWNGTSWVPQAPVVSSPLEVVESGGNFDTNNILFEANYLGFGDWSGNDIPTNTLVIADDRNLTNNFQIRFPEYLDPDGDTFRKLEFIDHLSGDNILRLTDSAGSTVNARDIQLGTPFFETLPTNPAANPTGTIIRLTELDGDNPPGLYFSESRTGFATDARSDPGYDVNGLGASIQDLTAIPGTDSWVLLRGQNEYLQQGDDWTSPSRIYLDAGWEGSSDLWEVGQIFHIYADDDNNAVYLITSVTVTGSFSFANIEWVQSCGSIQDSATIYWIDGTTRTSNDDLLTSELTWHHSSANTYIDLGDVGDTATIQFVIPEGALLKQGSNFFHRVSNTPVIIEAGDTIPDLENDSTNYLEASPGVEVDNRTIELNSNGQLRVKDAVIGQNPVNDGITNSKIADSAIQSRNISNFAVLPEKLGRDVVFPNSLESFDDVNLHSRLTWDNTGFSGSSNTDYPARPDEIEYYAHLDHLLVLTWDLAVERIPSVSVGDKLGFDASQHSTSPTVIVRVADVGSREIRCNVLEGASSVSTTTSHSTWNAFLRANEDYGQSGSEVLSWDGFNEEWRPGLVNAINIAENAIRDQHILDQNIRPWHIWEELEITNSLEELRDVNTNEDLSWTNTGDAGSGNSDYPAVPDTITLYEHLSDLLVLNWDLKADQPNISVGDKIGFGPSGATEPTIALKVAFIDMDTNDPRAAISCNVLFGTEDITTDSSDSVWASLLTTSDTYGQEDGDILIWNNTDSVWVNRAPIIMQSGVPTSEFIGQEWIDTDNNNLYKALSVGANIIDDGQWARIDDITNLTGAIGTGDGLWTDTVNQEIFVDLATESGLGFVDEVIGTDTRSRLTVNMPLSRLSNVAESGAHNIAAPLDLYLTGQSGAWDILIDRGNVHRVLIRSLVNPTDLGLSNGDEIKIPVTLNDGSQAFIPTTFDNTTTGSHNGRTIHDTFVEIDPDQGDWSDGTDTNDYQNIQDTFGVDSIGTSSEGWTSNQQVFDWIESEVNYLRLDNSNVQLRVHTVYYSKNVQSNDLVALSRPENSSDTDNYELKDPVHHRQDIGALSRTEIETIVSNEGNALIGTIRQDFLDLVNNATDRHRNVVGDYTVVWCGGQYYPGNNTTTTDYGYEFNTHLGLSGMPLVPRDGTQQSDITTGNAINAYLVSGLSRVADDDSDGTGYHLCADAVTDFTGLAAFTAFFGSGGNARWKDNSSGTYDFEHNIQQFGRDSNSQLQNSFDNSRTMFGFLRNLLDSDLGSDTEFNYFNNTLARENFTTDDDHHNIPYIIRIKRVNNKVYFQIDEHFFTVFPDFEDQADTVYHTLVGMQSRNIEAFELNDAPYDTDNLFTPTPNNSYSGNLLFSETTISTYDPTLSLVQGHGSYDFGTNEVHPISGAPYLGGSSFEFDILLTDAQRSSIFPSLGEPNNTFLGVLEDGTGHSYRVELDCTGVYDQGNTVNQNPVTVRNLANEVYPEYFVFSRLTIHVRDVVDEEALKNIAQAEMFTYVDSNGVLREYQADGSEGTEVSVGSTSTTRISSLILEDTSYKYRAFLFDTGGVYSYSVSRIDLSDFTVTRTASDSRVSVADEAAFDALTISDIESLTYS